MARAPCWSPTRTPSWRTPSSRPTRSDIALGGTFPDYTLPDHTSTVRTLSELQGRDPLILTLARGHYCSKEHQQHLELAAFPIEDRGGLHPDSHDLHRRAPHPARVPRIGRPQWTFLSDPGRTIQQDLDIQEYTDLDNDPMIPHTFVLKPGLVIHSIYNGYWFVVVDAGRGRSPSGPRS